MIEFVFNIEPTDLTSFTEDQLQEAKKGSKSTQGSRVPGKPIRERIAGQSLLATWAASGVVVAALVWGFWFFAPLTYGTPGLSVEQVLTRKWLNYDLHFAK